MRKIRNRRRSAGIQVAAHVFVLLSLTGALHAQGPLLSVSPGNTIHTIAGNGATFFSGDNGPATSAALAKPTNVAADAAGNIYIADANNHRVRLVDASGKITTFAGNGVQGFLGDGGPATSASLNTPTSVAVHNNTVYIADSGNNVIRAVSGGTITTFAGSGAGAEGYSGDGGPAISALLSCPRGVAVDANGNLFIADTKNHVVRRVVGGTITTLAGNGQQGFQGDNGPAIAASLDTPTSIALDLSGNVFIADTHNQRIRLVTGGNISTFAGNGALGFLGEGTPAVNAAFDRPLGVAADGSGNVYIADSNNQRVRRVDTTGTITTVVANGQEAFFGDSGPPLQASLDTPSAAVPFNGRLLVTDKDNQRIRLVDPTSVPIADQIVGTTSGPQSVTLSNAGGGTLTLNLVTLSSGDFTLAGGGSCGSSFPVSLAGGASCTLHIVFTPTIVGPRSGTLQITDNAPGNPQSITVVGNGIQDSTTLALVSSQATSTYGGSITLAATITPGVATTAPSPTGGVSFADGANVLGSSQLNAGAASFSTSALSAGSHTITATFSGDLDYSGNSASFTQVVNKATPTVTLAVQPNPIVQGQPSVLTATVNSSAGVPTGTVTITDNGTSLGNPPVNASGVATLTVTLTGGSHALLAVYNGDANFATFSSATINVQFANFTVSSQPANATIRTGQMTTFTISITPAAGFTSPVTLSCSNVPTNAACSFSQSTVTPNGATVSTMMTFRTSLTASVGPFGQFGERAAPFRPIFLLIGILAVWQLWLWRNRRLVQPKWLTACAILTIVFLGIGCASSGSSGSSGSGSSQTTPPGTYSVTVTASTSGAGAQSQSLTLSITVTP
jgi:sugar lactone lactonase YvrE